MVLILAVKSDKRDFCNFRFRCVHWEKNQEFDIVVLLESMIVTLSPDLGHQCTLEETLQI